MDAAVGGIGFEAEKVGGGRGAFVFLNRVGPDGMMIVPVGQKERDAFVSDAQSLVAQVEQALGYQPSR